MNTIKINKGSAKLVAHRGVSKLERENTNAAFIAAGNRSYYGIETDIHKTRDGVFVAIHDQNTKRITNDAADIDVCQVNFDQIKEIVLPDIDGNTYRQDLRIPLLEEYIDICKKYDKVGVLELKDVFSTDDLERIIDIIQERDYLHGVTFISFIRDNCTLLRQLLPEQPIQLLLAEAVTEEDKCLIYKNRFDIDIYYPKLDEATVRELHENNVKINCWTCDDPDEAANLIAMGVDYITTNLLE